MTQDQGSQIDPGGAAGLATGARSFNQRVQDWIRKAVADALAKRDGRTSLKVNGAQIGVRQHLDVQMSGATGEDHPELDLTRMILPAGGGSSASCEVYHNTAQTVTSGSFHTLVFNSEWYKSDASMHSTSTHTSRLVAPSDGVYLITARVRWLSTGSANEIQMRFKVNADSALYYLAFDERYMRQQSGFFLDTDQTLVCTRKLVAGDYVECDVYQDSGGSTLIVEASDASGSEASSPYFTLTRIG